jgi:MFS family permease
MIRGKGHRSLLSRQQVRLLLPLGIALASSLTGDSTLYAVLANQIDVLGIGLASVGVLLGANRLVRIPGNLLAGTLYDRLRRRRLFLTGLVLGVISSFSYGLARGFWPLLAARVLWGMAWSLINVGGYTMIIDCSTPADRGRMTGFYQLAFMVGLAVSPMLGGMLTDALGFRAAVWICAAVSGTGFVVALLFLPETRPALDEPRPKRARRMWRQRLEGAVGVWRQMDRRILLAAYIYMVTFFVNGGVLMSTMGLYLGQRWGAGIPLAGIVIGTASLAGGILALRALLGMLAGPLAGTLSDRLQHRWPVVYVGLALGIVGFLALTLKGGIWSVLAGVALVAASAGALIAVLAALVGDLAGDRKPGVTMGGLATAGDFGSATGPLLAYALASILNLRWVYLLCAVLLTTGLIAALGHKGAVEADNDRSW